MKTINWQTKALTLFIAAAALLLATACGKEYAITYPSDGLRIISSDRWEPCENEKPLKPSREFVQLANQQDPIQTSYPTDAFLRTLPGYEEAMDAWGERLIPERERVYEALLVHINRLERYPHFRSSTVAWQFTWGDIVTDKLIVEIHLHHLVDPRTVPPEDRIPGCIAGVPVHIVVGKKFATPES